MARKGKSELSATPGAQAGASVSTTRVRTLSDLARLAGVSTGTASRALANKDLVNRETREHIQALARQHGFRPNQMASKLRTQRTGLIGIAIPLGHERRQHISDPFFLTLLGYLADELTESGYDILLSRVIPARNEDWLERLTGSGMIDGLIVIGQSNQSSLIDAVAGRYRPMVVWGSSRAGRQQCVVGTDNVKGGTLSAQHLIDRGASKLAFLGDTAGIEIADRLSGAKAAASRAGVSLVQAAIHLSGEEMPGQIADFLDAAGSEIDGIIAASDVIAMACLRELHQRQRHVPADIQVVGFDDLPLAAQTNPPLTTIRQDIETGARALVERLQARIAGDDASGLLMAPRLVIRDSTRSHT